MRIACDWLSDPDVVQVFDLLQSGGNRVYAVGGCVRDTLLGKTPRDVDFATDARPETVISLANDADIGVLLHGARFGTVTLIISMKPQDITSFRKDIRTDGRHADVAYTNELELDARRRDFTINAMYVNREGLVIDPVGGLKDIASGRVRFVGDARKRIEEDTLRVLRFFRINAELGNLPVTYDAEAYRAVAACNRGRLTGLSGYRITSEMLKLLAADIAIPTLSAMSETGILPTLFPDADIDAARRLTMLEQELDIVPDAARMLYLLGTPALNGQPELPRRTRLHLDSIRKCLDDDMSVDQAGYRFGLMEAISSALLRATLGDQIPPADLCDRAYHAAVQKMPVAASDLIPLVERTEISRHLRKMEDSWIASGFTMTKQELLDCLTCNTGLNPGLQDQ